MKIGTWVARKRKALWQARFAVAQHWNSHWSRVEAKDEAMKTGPRATEWVARKRKALWQVRFAVAVANCNARMISRSHHITD